MSEASPTAGSAAPVAQVPSPGVPGLSGLLALAVGVVVVAALYLAREVLIPITLAVLLSFVLAPLVALLQRARLPRIPAVLLAVALAIGVMVGLGWVIGKQLVNLAQDVPRYASVVERKIGALRERSVGPVGEVITSLSRMVEGRPQEGAAGGQAGRPATPSTPPATGRATSPALTPAPPAPPAEQRPVPVEVRTPDPPPLELAERVLSPVLSPLATVGVVLIVAIFILLQQEDLRDRVIRLFGSSDLHKTTRALDDAARRLSRYFLAQLMINASFGLVISAGLYCIGVPSPILWGILAGLLRFVPYIGTWLGAALPLVLAAAVDAGWGTVVWTAGLFLVVDLITGQVVEPIAYGHSAGLSPTSVVVAAIFWTWLWGPVGLVLSTPLTLCLVVLGRYVERMEFLDVMLGDRPALTPAESFYQRILAGDVDEVQEQAETLLKRRPLSAYYDEVALRGLQLAAADAARGVLGLPQVEKVRESAQQLIDELAAHDHVQPEDPKAKKESAPETTPLDAKPEDPPTPPPPSVAPEALPPGWGGKAPVLCLAGRGPLDEAVSTMLAQLLAKHGLGARVLPYVAASRGHVSELEAEGVRMVCLSYLDISGRPAHLRYLLQRLRRRLPEAKLMVGMWPETEEVLHDPQLRSALGADVYVTSLRAAVEACVAAATTGAEKRS